MSPARAATSSSSSQQEEQTDRQKDSSAKIEPPRSSDAILTLTHTLCVHARTVQSILPSAQHSRSSSSPSSSISHLSRPRLHSSTHLAVHTIVLQRTIPIHPLAAIYSIYLLLTTHCRRGSHLQTSPVQSSPLRPLLEHSVFPCATVLYSPLTSHTLVFLPLRHPSTLAPPLRKRSTQDRAVDLRQTLSI